MNATRMTGGLAGIFFGFLVFVSAPYAYEMNGAGDDLGTYNEDWQSSGAQVQEAANVDGSGDSLDTYNDVWKHSNPQVQEAANVDGSDDDLGTYNEDYSKSVDRDLTPARPVKQSFKIRSDESAPAGIDSADDLGTYDEDWQTSDARGHDAAPSGHVIVGLTTQREADEMESDVWGNWQLDQDKLNKSVNYQNTVIFGVDSNLIDDQKSFTKTA